MDDLKLLKRAKLYTDAMSQGINPLTGEYVSNADSLSQDKLQNCMQYISDILSDRIRRMERKPKTRKILFSITPSQKSMVKLSDEPIGVNGIAKNINAVIDTEVMRSVSGVKIAEWMVEQGYLDIVQKEDNKTQKVINDRSAAFGITERDAINIETGEIYKKPVYNKTARKYIIDHIEEINRRK